MSRPIIIKFISYRSRLKVFKVKKNNKKLKDLVGFRRIRTADGSIFIFDRNGKIFNEKSHEDLKGMKPVEETGVGHPYK